MPPLSAFLLRVVFAAPACSIACAIAPYVLRLLLRYLLNCCYAALPTTQNQLYKIRIDVIGTLVTVYRDGESRAISLRDSFAPLRAAFLLLAFRVPPELTRAPCAAVVAPLCCACEALSDSVLRFAVGRRGQASASSTSSTLRQ